MLTNWKTTAAGVASILTALADLATAFSQGNISGNLATDVTAIIAGVGLLFAKDASSTTTTITAPSVTTTTK